MRNTLNAVLENEQCFYKVSVLVFIVITCVCVKILIICWIKCWCNFSCLKGSDVSMQDNILIVLALLAQVRCRAAHCLTKVANAMVANWNGPPAMMQIFRKMFGSFSCPNIIRQHDFTSLQNYYILKVCRFVIITLTCLFHYICILQIANLGIQTQSIIWL